MSTKALSMTMFYLKRAMMIAFFIGLTAFAVILALFILLGPILWRFWDLVPSGVKLIYSLVTCAALYCFFNLDVAMWVAPGKLWDEAVIEEQYPRLRVLNRIGENRVRWIGSFLSAGVILFMLLSPFPFDPTRHDMNPWMEIPWMLLPEVFRIMYSINLLFPCLLFGWFAYEGFKETRKRVLEFDVIEKNDDKNKPISAMEGRDS